MGKQQDEEAGNTSFDSPSKRHKKHKKHKHKHERRRRDLDESLDVGDVEEDELVDVVSPSQQPAIKLKIKLAAGGVQSPPSQSSQPAKQKTSTPEKLVRVPSSASLDSPWQATAKDDVFVTKKAGDDTSDEEREWLDALEAGKLDDNGELKKEKDESLLTARQRALLHGRPNEQLLELPSGYKQPELTEEQLVKRQQKAKKRREQAQAKQEKDKKQTLDRLLKKQDSSKKSRGRGSRRSHAPSYRYHNTAAGITVSVPQGFSFPFHSQRSKSASSAALCGVDGCGNLKKYSCSKTGIPLCSLQCYKKNLSTTTAATSIAVT